MSGQDPYEGTAEFSDGSEETSASGTVDGNSGGHPAWQEILSAIPEEYRDAVRPTLEKWDTGVNKKIQSLHSQYEPYKPFTTYDPSVLETAVSLMEKIEADPKAVWELMGQTYGFVSEQGAEEEVSESFDFNDVGGELDPAVAAMLQQQQQAIEELRQQLGHTQQTQEESRLQEQLDNYLGWLEQEKGGFDEEYVVALMAQGISGEDAVDRYNETVRAAMEQSGWIPPEQNAPVVLGSGGGVPSNGIDPKALDNSQTKDLVAQMLEQAARNG